jgi:hypothetical protein
VTAASASGPISGQDGASAAASHAPRSPRTASSMRARPVCSAGEAAAPRTASHAQGSTPGMVARWRQIRFTSGIPTAARSPA